MRARRERKMERQPLLPQKNISSTIKTLRIKLGSYTSLQTIISFHIMQHYCASRCDVIKHSNDWNTLFSCIKLVNTFYASNGKNVEINKAVKDCQFQWCNHGNLIHQTLKLIVTLCYSINLRKSIKIGSISWSQHPVNRLLLSKRKQFFYLQDDKSPVDTARRRGRSAVVDYLISQEGRQKVGTNWNCNVFEKDQ